MTSRENIYSALYSRLATSLSVSTSSRIPKTHDQVDARSQPFMCMVQTDQQMVAEVGRPPKWLLGATVCLYAWENQGTGPLPTINALVDQVQAALLAQPGERGPNTTLGGLVERVSLRSVQVDTLMPTSEQAVAFVDLEILAA